MGVGSCPFSVAHNQSEEHPAQSNESTRQQTSSATIDRPTGWPCSRRCSRTIRRFLLANSSRTRRVSGILKNRVALPVPSKLPYPTFPAKGGEGVWFITRLGVVLAGRQRQQNHRPSQQAGAVFHGPRRSPRPTGLGSRRYCVNTNYSDVETARGGGAHGMRRLTWTFLERENPPFGQ